MEQVALFDLHQAPGPDRPEPDLDSYDTILVMHSGGKDSTGATLELLERGVPREKIELWHHEIDGRESASLMDWPVTPAYCQAFADALGVPLYFSWRKGGFEREMTRQDAATAPTVFETPDGLCEVGGKGPRNTRMMFPQVAASLSVRWCSSALKIDVAAAAVRNQDRFNGRRVLVVTGERGQESPQRARYASLEPHKADRRDGRGKRLIDHWRPLLDWREEQVWGIIERWRIAPHPAYEAGFGRCSCAFCIFGNENQFASARNILPEQFERIAHYEKDFGKTIKRKGDIVSHADAGRPYEKSNNQALADELRSTSFNRPIIVDEGQWRLPAGAFGDSCGPA